MIVTTYCTAQSLILQLISSDELLVLLWVSVIEVTVGAGEVPIAEHKECNEIQRESMNNNSLGCFFPYTNRPWWMLKNSPVIMLCSYMPVKTTIILIMLQPQVYYAHNMLMNNIN